ncbi:MAG TPA: NAD(P)-dependent oxidoreductase [Steroidobacteraceae bacterium]|jgi:3-hydroxyisobutyrate dehydrogenase|nr:NAD(P)-dependent oxidoreductase [Steroidobacteraceae bacterium]
MSAATAEVAINIGFVGLGAMGRPMASHIARAGHSLTVFDADVAAAQRLAAGAAVRIARGPEDFQDTEVLVTMLPTGAIVRDVLLGPKAIAPALPKGALVIDMSSSEPEGTRELGAILGGMGLALVDAPVSGGVPRATDGTLTIMIGGEGSSIARARPVLEHLGKRLFEVGALGAGHAMKALNNYVSAAAFQATSEALLIGTRFGIDPTQLIDILNVSTGRTFHSELSMKDHVIAGRHAAGFLLALAAKDVRIAQGLAASLRIQAPMLQLSAQQMTAASEKLGPKADVTEAIKVWD